MRDLRETPSSEVQAGGRAGGQSEADESANAGQASDPAEVDNE